MSLFPSPTDLFATRLREVAHQDHPAALTVTQLAQLLDVSRGSIYKLIELGQIRCIHVLSAIRIPIDEVLRLYRGESSPSDLLPS